MTESRRVKIIAELSDKMSPALKKQKDSFKTVYAAALSLNPVIQKQSKHFNVLRMSVDDVTDQLKMLGKRGEQLANTLEDISDPLERIRLGNQMFRQELARLDTPIGKTSTKIQVMGARMSQISPRFGEMVSSAGRATIGFDLFASSLGVTSAGLVGAGGLVAGVLAAEAAVILLAAAAGKVAFDSWMAFAESNEEAKKALEDLTKATDGFEIALGKAVEETVDATTIVLGLTVKVKELTAAMAGLAEEDSVDRTDRWLEQMKNASGPVSILADGTLRLSRELRNAGLKAKESNKDWDDFTKSMGAYGVEVETGAEEIFRLKDMMDQLLDPAAKVKASIRGITLELKLLTQQDMVSAVRQTVMRGLDPDRYAGTKRRGGGRRRETASDRLVKEIISRPSARLDKPGAAVPNQDIMQGVMGMPDIFSGMKMQRFVAEMKLGLADIEKMKREADMMQVGMDNKLDLPERDTRRTDQQVSTDRQIERLIAEAEAVASLREGYEDLTNMLNTEGQQALVGMVAGFGELAGAAAAGGASTADFGELMVKSLQGLLRAIAPAFIQMGIGLVGVQTGDAVGLIMAGTALSVIAGQLSQYKSNKGSAVSADNTSRLRAIANEFQGNRPDREQRTFKLFIEREGLDGVVGSVVRDGAQRGRFPAALTAGFMP